MVLTLNCRRRPRVDAQVNNNRCKGQNNVFDCLGLDVLKEVGATNCSYVSECIHLASTDPRSLGCAALCALAPSYGPGLFLAVVGAVNQRLLLIQFRDETHQTHMTSTLFLVHYHRS